MTMAALRALQAGLVCQTSTRAPKRMQKGKIAICNQKFRCKEKH